MSVIVHVIDDDEPMRTALARLLRAEGHEVRTHASAGDFLMTPIAQAPGCIVLDLKMPGPSGLELQQALERYPTALPIVFLTGHGDIASSVRAMKAGAVDFLTKPVAPDVLLSAVATALSRDRLAREARGHLRDAQSRYARLTARERSVFSHVVSGRLNKQIADDLGIAERTVKMHRAQMMTKMQAGSVAELVRVADLLGHALPPMPTRTPRAS